VLTPYCTLNGEAQEKSFRLGLERHRGAVHAVAQTGFGRAIGKDMTEMAIAGGTANLDPAHAETIVFDLGDRFRISRRVEAGPAAAAVKLVVRFKQFAAASGTEKFAITIFRVQRSGKRPLGAGLAQHMILFRRQLLPPFFVAQYCFFHPQLNGRWNNPGQGSCQRESFPSNTVLNGILGIFGQNHAL